MENEPVLFHVQTLLVGLDQMSIEDVHRSTDTIIITTVTTTLLCCVYYIGLLFCDRVFVFACDMLVCVCVCVCMELFRLCYHGNGESMARY